MQSRHGMITGFKVYRGLKKSRFQNRKQKKLYRSYDMCIFCVVKVKAQDSLLGCVRAYLQRKQYSPSPTGYCWQARVCDCARDPQSVRLSSNLSSGWPKEVNPHNFSPRQKRPSQRCGIFLGTGKILTATAWKRKVNRHANHV